MTEGINPKSPVALLKEAANANLPCRAHGLHVALDRLQGSAPLLVHPSGDHGVVLIGASGLPSGLRASSSAPDVPPVEALLLFLCRPETAADGVAALVDDEAPRELIANPRRRQDCPSRDKLTSGNDCGERRGAVTSSKN